MNFYIKHITLRKHKDYTEANKVFILNFSKSTKDLLKKSNIFTKGVIIPTCYRMIKDFYGRNTDIKINIMDQTWADGVSDKINTINFKLRIQKNRKLINKIHNLEMYWQNGGTYIINPEKFGDVFQHLIPIEKHYTDINEIIEDMNDSFNGLYREED